MANCNINLSSCCYFGRSCTLPNVTPCSRTVEANFRSSSQLCYLLDVNNVRPDIHRLPCASRFTACLVHHVRSDQELLTGEPSCNGFGWHTGYFPWGKTSTSPQRGATQVAMESSRQSCLTVSQSLATSCVSTGAQNMVYPLFPRSYL